MLLVNASKGASKFHGIGLIAREPIAQGQVIWVYDESIDHAITIPQLRKLSQWAAEQVVWYAFFDEGLEVFILSGDDDRFTNHSDNPNSGFAGKWRTEARRHIAIDEEITISYSIWNRHSLLVVSQIVSGEMGVNYTDMVPPSPTGGG